MMMMDPEDGGYATTDEELDSDNEDADVELDLKMWLKQLDSPTTITKVIENLLYAVIMRDTVKLFSHGPCNPMHGTVHATPCMVLSMQSHAWSHQGMNFKLLS